MKIRDRLWIWGQDVMSHHRTLNNCWKLPGENKMDSAAGAKHLGIDNIFRVVMQGKPLPPFDPEMDKLTHAKKVVWSILGDMGSQGLQAPDDLDEVLHLAEKYPQIGGGIFDDFFYGEEKAAALGHWGRLPVERVAEIRDALHNFSRPLELYIVIYEAILQRDCKAYLELCDCITYWTWCSENLAQLPANLDKVRTLAPGKKYFGGLYGHDYGNQTFMPLDRVRKQCEFYTNALKKDELQGVIVCSNCIADIGLPAMDYIRDWIAEVGEEEVHITK
ncbi:MAG: hypothetical protein J6S73_06185 [Lentisphaeria bacterium]|nr:hypothetical protein [Lentisphaeria bacterium]